MSSRCNASGGRCDCARLKARVQAPAPACRVPPTCSDHELWRRSGERGRSAMVRSSTADTLCRGRVRSMPAAPWRRQLPPSAVPPRLVPSVTLMEFCGARPPAAPPAGATSAPASPADGRVPITTAGFGQFTARGMVIQEGCEEDSSGVSSSSSVYVSDGGAPPRPRTLELRGRGRDQSPPSPSPDRAPCYNVFGSKLDLFLEILETQDRLRRVSTYLGQQTGRMV